MKKPVVLVILDGFGYRKDDQYNAVAQAHMRNFNAWLLEYPHALLQASGTAVGLPEHTVGNSLVGHLTLGSGRVIKQSLTVLDEAIADGTFFENQLLQERFAQLKQAGGTLHLMGLLSDGGSHSHEQHLYALLRMAHKQGLTNIVVHAFLDGRDAPPRSAAHYLENLDRVFKEIGCGVLGSIHGRAYAMDRAGKQEYIQKTYDVLTQPHTSQFTNWQEALRYYYNQGLSDETIPPTTLVTNSYMKQHDGLIFFNIRADRAQGLMYAILEHAYPAFSWIITAVRYSPEFSVDVLYPFPNVENTLLDALEEAQKKTFVVAESEKYAHVSYFFNGGRDIVHPHEMRLVIPSLAPEKLIEHPEMCAPEITDSLLRSLTKNPRDFYLVNYANPDMIGHTGDFDATVKALACIDIQLERLYSQIVEKMQGTMYVVADHGKAEEMYDPEKRQAKTGHTANPVYFVMLNKEFKHHPNILPLEGLAQVAPFILHNMHIPVPAEMQAVKTPDVEDTYITEPAARSS
jgi:2,3-bisphosphoglycerate-independent phosphoglycerate mutase